MNLNDLNTDGNFESVTVLLFGAPKSGKTASLASLAEAGFHIHLLDLERGVKTLLDPNILKPEFRKNVTVYRIPDTQATPTAIDSLIRIVKIRKVDICDAHGKVNCVTCKKESPTKFTTLDLTKFTSNDILVIDTLSQLAESAINHVMNPVLAKDDTAKAEWTDYRKQGDLMSIVLGFIQAGGINVVALTHEVMADTEDGKKKLVPVSGSSNFSRNSAKYFDHVVYCEVMNKKHRLYNVSTHSNSILTGSRSSVDLSKEEKPTLLPLFRHLRT